jgi:hypothetical protein
MRRSLLALPLIAAVLAGCADVSPLSPSGPRRNTEPTYEFVVSGNTLGPKGQLWQVTSSPTVCQTSYWMYWANFPSGGSYYATSKAESHCQTTALGTWGAEPYDGGQVSVTGEYNGQYEHLATVTGDLSVEAHTSDLVGGVMVTLQAYPNTGCQLWHYENMATGAWITTNPYTVDPRQVSSVKAWFTCS